MKTRKLSQLEVAITDMLVSFEEELEFGTPQHQLRKCWTGRSPTVQKTDDWNLKAEKWTLDGNLRLQTSVSVAICPLNVELGFMR